MPYDNSNSGMLARNERKQQPNHPDFSGQCEIGNPPVQYWISGWIKEGKPGSKFEGKKFFSLAFKPKDQQQSPAQPAAQPKPAVQPKPAPAPAPVTVEDEDVPF